MKGTKYLSDLVNIETLQKSKLNIIRAPTGSGKTYFALTSIPAISHNALHSTVYLIDTINGKEQIINNYNAISEYWGWAKDIDSDGVWFEDDKHIVILTYAKFGILCQRYADFSANFDYIICDELHSLFHFQNFSPKPNNHSVALMGIRSAVRNEKTTVIALSATPSIIQREIGTPWQEIPIDREQVFHYDQEQVIPYTNLEYILSSQEVDDIGLCYTGRITQMLGIQEMAIGLGLSPICIWSTANKDYKMTEEQLAVRESILQNYSIPEQYNFLIINSSSETSIKIKSRVDYVIVNSTNQDTQVQVRGRVNNDLRNLYLLNDGTQPIDLPDEFLNVKLFAEGKERLCDFVNLKNPYRRQYKWPTVKTLLMDNDYTITEGREKNMRFVVISLPSA